MGGKNDKESSKDSNNKESNENLFTDEKFNRSNNVLKEIWCKLNDDDKNCMWDWIDTFVKITEAYQIANKNKET